MKKNSKKTICRQASIFYYDYIQNAVTNDIEPEILSHIEKCAFCQSEIERLKAVLAEPAGRAAAEKINRKNAQVTAILASHFNLANEEVTCGIAKRFMPSLASLPFDIKIPTPITAHIEHCTMCKHDIDAIRSLKLTDEQFNRLVQVIASQIIEHGEESLLQGESIKSLTAFNFDNNALAVLKHIIERQESGIITEYVTKRPTNAETAREPYGDYTNWHAEVVVHNGKKKTADKIDWTARQTGSHGRISQLVKPLVAAAAVVFIAVWLFFGAFAKAIEFSDIYDVIIKVQNICLATGDSEVNEATQKIWISKPLNIKVLYSAGQWILWSVQNKTRKTLTDGTAPLETDKLSETELTNVKQTMDIPSVLLPFQDPHFLPAEYHWKLLAAAEVSQKLHNTNVYDLLWSDKTVGGQLVYKKWRAYIDKDTLLPKRVESWQKQSPADEYELKNWMDITYPQTQDVEELIHKTSFDQK